MIIRQDYLNRLIHFKDTDVIKVLTGMRRTGKSTILKMYRDWLLSEGVPKQNLIYINFESLQFVELTDLMPFYDYIQQKSKNLTGKLYLLFDEIQNVKQWEKAINSFRVDLDCDITITGSNANLLSGELATLLTGRYVEIEVFPLSFKEYLDFVQNSSKELNTEAAFREYIQFGGLPGLHEFKGSAQAKTQYLADIFDSVLLKDVLSRNKVRDVELLKRILLFVFDNIGNPFSAKKVSEFLKNQGRKLGVETIYNYISFLENAFVVDKCSRLDLKGKRFLETLEKIYVMDLGIRNSLIGYKPSDISWMLENAVYLNLRQQRMTVSIGKNNDTEIDFVAEKENKRLYFQVCYQLTPENFQREISPLLKLKDNHPKFILTMSSLMDGHQDGIIIENIVSFCRNPIERYLI